MIEVIKELEKIIGDNRDKKSARIAINYLINVTKNKIIELNKEYYVSEWSWSPMCDGIFVYDEIIRNCKDFGITKAYCTNKNYRTYFAWDIYESEENCKMVTNFKKSFAYDWDIVINDFIKEIGAKNELGVWM